MPGRARTLLALAVLALMVAAPVDAAAANAGRQKAKPRQVNCRTGQATVTVGKRKRCVRIRTSTGTQDPAASLLRGFVTRNFGVVRIRGKKVKSIWKQRGMKRVRTRLLRAIPKVMAFLQTPTARAARVPGDPGACGNTPQGRGDSASFDGFSMTLGSNGDVSMSVDAAGYAIQVFIGGAMRCSDLDLPECPTAAGELKGTDGRRTAMGLRITQNGALVQSLRTTVRSTQKMTGQVEQDAKLDTMSLEDVANETTEFQVPGGSVSLRLSVLRTVKLNMRTGAFIQSPRVRVGFGFRGHTQASASAAAAQAARAYEQSFPDLIRDERDAYRRRETIWQGPGRCAKVTFAPETDRRDVTRDETATVTPTVESNAGGAAAKAKWTITAPEHGTFTPDAAEVPSPPIQFHVTGRERQKLKAMFKATSTAGVAEAPWSQTIVERERYYRVTDFQHRNQLSLDNLMPVAGCTPSTSQNNTATLKPSGQAFDGAIGPDPQVGGDNGTLIARADIGQNAHFNGCKLNDDGTAWIHCAQNRTGTLEMAIIVDVLLPPEGLAILTWQLLPATIGDVPPIIDPCVVFGGQAATLPDPVVTTVPREVFTEPGPQTISVDTSFDMPAVGNGTIHSAANYTFSFVRVNQDGSDYG